VCADSVRSHCHDPVVADDAPAVLDLPRHRDLEGRNYEPWLRRMLIVVMLAVVFAGLLNVFGQTASVSTAAGAGGRLSVEAPSSLRGGLLFQARFQISPTAGMAKPVLVLQRGWVEGMSINTLEPSPVDETWRGDALELTLPPIAAGQTFSFYMQFQVNPTNVGRHPADVTLRDGDTPVATVHHTLTIYP
jgi:hypothetical protein